MFRCPAGVLELHPENHWGCLISKHSQTWETSFDVRGAQRDMGSAGSGAGGSVKAAPQRAPGPQLGRETTASARYRRTAVCESLEVSFIVLASWSLLDAHHLSLQCLSTQASSEL